MAMASASISDIPVGKVKRFGEYGPEYEVRGPAESEAGVRRVKIVLVRTGEETDYGFEAMLRDPEAL
jgi:hypothetical protein